ncbi:hypothetical protein OXYTRIMIC_161 [Oxytricha trifallax]|uniref:Uncharacterized protein n=1 Tax=Oxytricha trifallax TaxID=1172189 RepID=A0A073IAM2_9SPIT|nr:hypothetical protein OXYTRIMIC_161 [Oxytricha trifallax]
MVAAVPQIEGLTADEFLYYAKNKPSLLSQLPDETDWLYLDKKRICDILLSLDKEGINLMIIEAKQKRRERLDQSQNLIVHHMKPEFVQALNNSLSYSVQKGRSAHLIKMTSQSKRRKGEVKEIKGEEVAMRGSKQKYFSENKRMMDEFKRSKSTIDDLVGYQALVNKFHETGIIDNEGRPFQTQVNMFME